MSRNIRSALSIAAALVFVCAVPAAAQSNDGGDRDRPTETREPARTPERPSLRRRPPPSDAPAPRRQPEPRNDSPRDNPSPTSFAPAPEAGWIFA